MKLRISFLLLSALGTVHSAEENDAKRIHAHLQVKDWPSACEEAAAAFERNPESQLLFEAMITAHAKSVKEKEMCAAWCSYHKQFPGCLEKGNF